MLKFSRFAGAFGFLAACALPGCGGGARVFPATVPSGPDWAYAGGVLYHRPHYAPTQQTASGIVPLLPYVPYMGGVVIVAP